MFAWAELEGVDTSALLATALPLGVCFVPGAEFEAGGASLRNWLRLSYATLDADQLSVGVQRVAQAVETIHQRDVVAR